MALPQDRHDSFFEDEEDLFGEVEVSSAQPIPRPEPASEPTTALHQPHAHSSISSAQRPSRAGGLALPPLRASRPTTTPTVAQAPSAGPSARQPAGFLALPPLRASKPTTSPTVAQAPCAGPSALRPAGSLALPPLSASRPTTSPNVAQASSASAIDASCAAASPTKGSRNTKASEPKQSESRKRSRDQVDHEGEQSQPRRKKAPRKTSRKTHDDEEEEGPQAGPTAPDVPPPPGYSSWASHDSATRNKSDPLKAQQEAQWAENERQAKLQGKSYAGPFLEAAEEKRRKKREAQRASRLRAKEGRSCQ